MKVLVKDHSVGIVHFEEAKGAICIPPLDNPGEDELSVDPASNGQNPVNGASLVCL
jgi:hypothetical protein